MGNFLLDVNILQVQILLAAANTHYKYILSCMNAEAMLHLYFVKRTTLDCLIVC